MNNLGGSLILLIIALILLYLAVTDRLSRLLDAKDVITGTKNVSGTTATVNTTSGTPIATNINVSLPTLPTFGNNAQVPA